MAPGGKPKEGKMTRTTTQTPTAAARVDALGRLIVDQREQAALAAAVAWGGGDSDLLPGGLAPATHRGQARADLAIRSWGEGEALTLDRGGAQRLLAALRRAGAVALRPWQRLCQAISTWLGVGDRCRRSRGARGRLARLQRRYRLPHRATERVRPRPLGPVSADRAAATQAPTLWGRAWRTVAALARLGDLAARITPGRVAAAHVAAYRAARRGQA